ncbi:MAG: NUDIX hydrolase [Chloroflexi bacterium]|nr:NUDIX hydrolase [Chloroflexota bacterium]
MSQNLAWRVIDEEVVYRDRWVEVLRAHVVLPGGREYIYTTLKRVPGAAVVAVNAAGEWLLQREYRHPLGRVIYQLPGGLVDPGEDPLTTAQRELLEETGYTAETWQELGIVQDNPGLIEGHTTLFLAKGLHKTQDPRPEWTESPQPEWRSLEWIRGAIRRKEIEDRVILAAVAFLWAQEEFCEHGGSTSPTRPSHKTVLSEEEEERQ